MKSIRLRARVERRVAPLIVYMGRELHERNTDEGSGWNNRPRILGSSRDRSNINTMSLSRPIAAHDDDDAFEIANGRHVAPDNRASNQVAPTKCHLNIHEAEGWDPSDGGMRIRVRRVDYKFVDFSRASPFTT